VLPGTSCILVVVVVEVIGLEPPSLILMEDVVVVEAPIPPSVPGSDEEEVGVVFGWHD
jgi:hypothetical protein